MPTPSPAGGRRLRSGPVPAGGAVATAAAGRRREGLAQSHLPQEMRKPAVAHNCSHPWGGAKPEMENTPAGELKSSVPSGGGLKFGI